MKLFLCSHFSSVGSLIKEEIDNKKVAFIPTASLREGYTGYVGSARKLFNKLGAAVTEIDWTAITEVDTKKKPGRRITRHYAALLRI